MNKNNNTKNLDPIKTREEDTRYITQSMYKEILKSRLRRA